MFNIKNGDVILFQGDSITDGNRGRSQDPNHIHGHGYQYIIASEMYADNFDKDFTVINRGITGNKISDLYGRWKEDCLNLKPTILSILIGINDMIFNWEHQSGSDPDRYEKIYRLLLDEVLEQNPDIFLIIMEPFFGDKPEEDLDKFFKSGIGAFQEKAKKIAEDYNAVFVPLQDLFDSYRDKTNIYKLLWDGIHPTTAGHQLIARRWKECVKEKLESMDLNDVPYDVVSEVICFCIANKKENTEWVHLPVANFDCYYSNTNFSKKWLSKIPDTILERELASGVSRVKLKM